MALDEALALVHNAGEQHYEAELYRLRGELLLQAGDETAAERRLSFLPDQLGNL